MHQFKWLLIFEAFKYIVSF